MPELTAAAAPPILKVVAEAVPAELRARPQWVLWRLAELLDTDQARYVATPPRGYRTWLVLEPTDEV